MSPPKRNESGIAAEEISFYGTMRRMTRLAWSLVLCTFVTGVFAQQSPHAKAILFLTHAALYKHSSLAPAEQAVSELGAKNGYTVKTLEGYKQDSRALDLSMISPAYLAQFDGLMLMTN